jgi:hypothetical protein
MGYEGMGYEGFDCSNNPTEDYRNQEIDLFMEELMIMK